MCQADEHEDFEKLEEEIMKERQKKSKKERRGRRGAGGGERELEQIILIITTHFIILIPDSVIVQIRKIRYLSESMFCLIRKLLWTFMSTSSANCPDDMCE